MDTAPVPATRRYPGARPDPDGETRNIPKAMWDGPRGDMLRELGFLPDDPNNLALTPARARAKEDAATARMHALVAKVNADVPGVSVIPWAIIPWSVWEGLNAEFLIKRDFLPSSPWNNLLLAADAPSSDFLGLPLHPRAAQPGLDENLPRLIADLRIEAQEEFQTTFAALTQGDWSALERHEAFRNEQFKKLFALTRHVADTVFGAAVCARHDALFGIGLSEVTA